MQREKAFKKKKDILYSDVKNKMKKIRDAQMQAS